MAYSDSDQRRVYLACRAIFTGPNALLRRSKKVRELVSTHQGSLQPLIQEFTTEKVINIIKHLLEKEIFQSDVKAKIEFPELFRSSPTRDAQRAASENDAARSTAEALEEVATRENTNESDDEKPKLPENAFKFDNASLNDVHKLRHTAVHRLPTTCRGVETLVKSAIRFAEALQDLLRAAQLETLRLEIDRQITTMELSKNSLEDAFCQGLQKIKRQREELDLQEKELAAKIISEDRDNNCLVGSVLQDSLSKLFDTIPAEENADDVDQLSNTNEKHPKDDAPIVNHATEIPSSTTKVPFITGSNDFHGFNPFEPSTIKRPVFDISTLNLSEPMRALMRERGLVEASTTGYSNGFHGFNPFEPLTIKNPLTDFRLGA
jgi:hypothetical protein